MPRRKEATEASPGVEDGEAEVDPAASHLLLGSQDSQAALAIILAELESPDEDLNPISEHGGIGWNELIRSARDDAARLRWTVQHPVVLGAIAILTIGNVVCIASLATSAMRFDVIYIAITTGSIATALGLPALDWRLARPVIKSAIVLATMTGGISASIAYAYIAMLVRHARDGTECNVVEATLGQSAPCAWALTAALCTVLVCLAMCATNARWLGWLCDSQLRSHALACLFVESNGWLLRGFALVLTASTLVGAAYGLMQPGSALWVLLPVSALATAVASQLLLSERYLSCVRSLVAARAAHGAAIVTAETISSLVYGTDTPDFEQLARDHFRCVRACDISLDALRADRPGAAVAVAALSRPARFGAVDAFVSHSWSDDPVAKHAALHAWRGRFVLRHGREPLVWLDRACLGTLGARDGLVCMPLWVSACDLFLVLAGETCLERLWCVLELYVHIQRGRDDDALELIDLADCAAARAQPEPACREARARLPALGGLARALGAQRKVAAVVPASVPQPGGSSASPSVRSAPLRAILAHGDVQTLLWRVRRFDAHGSRCADPAVTDELLAFLQEISCGDRAAFNNRFRAVLFTALDAAAKLRQGGKAAEPARGAVGLARAAWEREAIAKSRSRRADQPAVQPPGETSPAHTADD